MINILIIIHILKEKCCVLSSYCNIIVRNLYISLADRMFSILFQANPPNSSLEIHHAPHQII